MAKEMQAHIPVLELVEPAPGEIAIGGDVPLKIRLTCPEGCELGGVPLVIEDAEGRALAHVPSSAEAIREVILKAPEKVGEQSWKVVVPPHEKDGIKHAACAHTIAFKTRAHTTSLAVWAVPSPVVIGERFSVKVGAKSSGGCSLAGRAIAISDASGTAAGRGTLGDTPWPGTSALYWAAVELPAPTQEGLAWYAVDFAAADAEAPHDRSASRFSVAIVRPPEHRLTIVVREKDTQAPIEHAEIRLGAYAAATDPSGHAEVAVPEGSYELTVWKAGYDAPIRVLDIRADLGIEIEAVALPPENPYAPWTE
jgi:hypothetical protein